MNVIDYIFVAGTIIVGIALWQVIFFIVKRVIRRNKKRRQVQKNKNAVYRMEKKDKRTLTKIEKRQKRQIEVEI